MTKKAFNFLVTVIQQYEVAVEADGPDEASDKVHGMDISDYAKRGTQCGEEVEIEDAEEWR